MLYFDVLGFRNLLERNPSQLYERYSRAIELLAAITAVHMNPNMGYSRIVDVDVFSDSGFVYFSGDDAIAWKQCCLFANNAFRSFLGHDLLISGAMARGRLWYDRGLRIRLGSGVTAAYQIAERLDCAGIVADSRESGEALSPNLIQARTKDGTREFRVPIRKGISGFPQIYLDMDMEQTWAKCRERAAADGKEYKVDDARALVDTMFQPPSM